MDQLEGGVNTSKLILGVVGFGAMSIAGLVLWAAYTGPDTQRGLQPGAETIPPEFYGSTPMFTPGVATPPVVAGADAELQPSDEVVGVVVDGQARAYLLDMFGGVFSDGAAQQGSSKVVNDFFNERAISITYDDRIDTVRVFTNDDATEHLPIWQLGWSDNRLQLMLRGAVEQATFTLEDDELPLPEYPFERTIWSKWIEKNPETEVFAGFAGNTSSTPPGAPSGPLEIIDPGEVEAPE